MIRINYSCIWSKDLIITKPELILEDFELSEEKKLKGEIYCYVIFKSQRYREEKIKIEGYFEMDLIAATYFPKFY